MVVGRTASAVKGGARAKRSSLYHEAPDTRHRRSRLLATMMQPSAAQPIPAHPQPGAEGWWVVCLCAAWCTTCNDYRSTFDAVAREWPGVRFEWVDIEDEAETMGDMEVETFPTLLVGDATDARFLGPLLPHFGVLHRLVDSLQQASDSKALADGEAKALLDRVRCSRR